jgi:hypothetical protein
VGGVGTWVHGRVGWARVRIVFNFWQKYSLNCKSIGLSPYLLPKLEDGWVQCEG